MSGGKEWTYKENEELKTLVNQGLKYHAISRRMRISYNRVRARIARLRLKNGYTPLPRLHKKGELAKRVRTLAVPGVTDTVIANILGVARITVRTCRIREGIQGGWKQNIRIGNPVTADISLAAKVLHLYSGVGKSNIAIANTLGISRTLVNYYIRKFGLQSLGKGSEGYADRDKQDTTFKPRVYTICR